MDGRMACALLPTRARPSLSLLVTDRSTKKVHLAPAVDDCSLPTVNAN